MEGHGLGLSIARLIIDGHAGRILVRTQYTKGSCFTITIPRQRGECRVECIMRRKEGKRYGVQTLSAVLSGEPERGTAGILWNDKGDCGGAGSAAFLGGTVYFRHKRLRHSIFLWV